MAGVGAALERSVPWPLALRWGDLEVGVRDAP